jgi:hypothetical protein
MGSIPIVSMKTKLRDVSGDTDGFSHRIGRFDSGAEHVVASDARLVERRTCNADEVGSIPSAGSPTWQRWSMHLSEEQGIVVQVHALELMRFKCYLAALRYATAEVGVRIPRDALSCSTTVVCPPVKR